jgi:FkbM family methyltransferase
MAPAASSIPAVTEEAARPFEPLRRVYRQVVPRPVRSGIRSAATRVREAIGRRKVRATRAAFRLALPSSPADRPSSRRAGPFGILRRPPLAVLSVDVPRRLYVAGVLRRSGLAGYEPDAVSVFLAALEALNCRLTFDIGANVGLYTLLASALTPTRAIAFEPEPTIAAALAWTIRVNGLVARVEPIAVGARNGRAPLYLSAATDASNSLRPGFRDATGTVEVPVVSLDNYCRTRRAWPELLKIDTETTEPDVVRGAAALLRRRPWILCEVLTDAAGAELEALLGPLGYCWFQIIEGELAVEREVIGRHATLDAPNWLFLPSRPPPGLMEAASGWRRRIQQLAPA